MTAWCSSEHVRNSRKIDILPGRCASVKTEAGLGSVVYNTESRPIRWQAGDTVVTIAFDRMGRRAEMRTMKDGGEAFQRFVYNNTLCVQ